MTDPTAGKPPAARVVEMVHAGAYIQILGALARLEIADHLAGGPRDAAGLASAVGAEPELLDRLLRAAAVLGLVERARDGMVAITSAGSCLRTGPGSLRDFVLAFSSPGQLRPMEHLAEAIRGQRVTEAALGTQQWDYYRDHPDEGAAFAGAMSGVSAMIAGQVAAAAAVTESRHIVDVGGGHGTLLRALLATAPQAQGVVLDRPEVVAAAPAAERIHFVAGDFLASVPPAADVYVLSHVLHDWDDNSAHRILGACRRAAVADTRLLVVEAVLPDQPGPVIPELLNLHMLVMSGGRERTRDQYGHLLGSADWQLDEVTMLPSGQSLLSGRPR